MRINYVLVDYENVQPKSVARFSELKLKVLLFIGANQTKIPVELAKSLQTLGDNVEYIQISGNGSNALDFHIAYMLGKIANTDPNGYFHIISKDTGFDPLIKFLRKKGMSVARSKSIPDIPIIKATASTAPSKTTELDLVEKLIAKGAAKPRKLATLKNFINALTGKTLSESEVDALVNELTKAKYINVTDGKVSYNLPKKDLLNLGAEHDLRFRLQLQ